MVVIKAKKYIQVNSEVDAPGAPPLPVVYHLERHGSHWLVLRFKC